MGNAQCVNYDAWPQLVGATWCADKGGTCTANGGSADVLYGSALSWKMVRLDDGESIRCNDNGFGCDPAPDWKKWCYISQYDMDIADTVPVADPNAVLVGSYLLPIVAIVTLLNCLLILWWSIRKCYCRKKSMQKAQYGVVKYETDTDLEAEEELKWWFDK